eukprot:363080-Chlamydomonas_euryale.AAC.6
MGLGFKQQAAAASLAAGCPLACPPPLPIPLPSSGCWRCLTRRASHAAARASHPTAPLPTPLHPHAAGACVQGVLSAARQTPERWPMAAAPAVNAC